MPANGSFASSSSFFFFRAAARFASSARLWRARARRPSFGAAADASNPMSPSFAGLGTSAAVDPLPFFFPFPVFPSELNRSWSSLSASACRCFASFFASSCCLRVDSPPLPVLLCTWLVTCLMYCWTFLLLFLFFSPNVLSSTSLWRCLSNVFLLTPDGAFFFAGAFFFFLLGMVWIVRSRA